MNVNVPHATARVLRQNHLNDDYTHVISIPLDFPEPDLSRDGRQPAMVHTYRHTDDKKAFVIGRYGTGENKSYSQFTVQQNAKKQMDWFAKGPGDNRPIYRLPEVMAAKDKTVLIVEGEKCADAVGCFTDCVSTTWSGGANALAKTDFSSLKGRSVIVIPDNDEPGNAAAEKLAGILLDKGAADVRIVNITMLAEECGLPAVKGFDIADAVSGGLDEEQFKKLLLLPDMLRTFEPADDLPTNQILREVLEKFRIRPNISAVFSLEENALVKNGYDRQGTPIKIYAGSPVVVIGRTKTNAGGPGWGYHVAVRAPDGEWVLLMVPAKLLAGTGQEMREMLGAAGFVIPQELEGRRALAEYIGYAQNSPIIDVATRPGWHGNAFALPQGIIRSDSDKKTTMLDMGNREHFFSEAGTLDSWKELARLAEHNSRAAFVICMAFAAPLLRKLGLEGGGVHLFGQSSRGKTTLLCTAGSVWGGGGEGGFIRNWRTTDNGVEGTVADHNDCLLPIDELAAIKAEDIQAALYMFTNGQGKARGRRDGTAKAAVQFKAMVLSSGERAVSQQITGGKGSAHMPGGVAVRMIDLPIEYAPGESFEDIGDHRDAGHLAERLNTIAKSNYGTAGPAFVQYLVDTSEETLELAQKSCDWFVDQLIGDGYDPQVRRVAQRFGVIGAAGVIAMKAGILPWDKQSIINAVETCFKAWIDARGGGESEERRSAKRDLKAFFEANGASRFEPFSEKIDPKREAEDTKMFSSRHTFVKDRCGFSLEGDDGTIVYYVFSEAWRTDVCANHDPDLMAKIADEQGALEYTEPGRFQLKKRLPGYPNGKRVYAIRPDLLK